MQKLISKQTGFSLIEVLVALVVLSVGMLGMAGMYVTTLRSGGDSISRAKAIYLVSDMVDRIRANPSAGATFAGAAGAVAACQAAQCTVAQMAQEDLRVWRRDITSLLPGGAGTVTVDATTTPTTYTVTIVWTDAGSTQQTYGVVTQL